MNKIFAFLDKWSPFAIAAISFVMIFYTNGNSQTGWILAFGGWAAVSLRKQVD